MPLPTRETLLEHKVLLPPPFTLVSLREMGDAFAHAISIADAQGAGTLVHVGRFDLAEFAVVLEPEEPLKTARRAFYAGMAALTDALAAHAQPETAIRIDWPDSVLVNGGLVGGGRLAWPQGAGEDKTPAWVVFGAMVRTASLAGHEPGASPFTTALDEEGFAGNFAGQLVESFAKHLMVGIDGWQADGFAAVARHYFEHMPPEKGMRRDIDDNGDLLIRRMGKPDVERKALLPLLAKPAWFDPASKGPRA
jgi:biotin-(acetyl-CoA carboxylase) ligase